MAEFTRYEICMLLNQPGPLLLGGIDLSGANLRDADLDNAAVTSEQLAEAKNVPEK